MNEIKPEKSTAYEIRRYLTPSSLTASQTVKTKGGRARKRQMFEPFTYEKLIDEQDLKVNSERLNPQTAANRASALRKFLEANFLKVEDTVGSEMRAEFSAAMERFIDLLRREGKSDRAISNTKSAFRTWRESVVEHDIVVAQDAEADTPFVTSLKTILKNHSIALVARQTGVPIDMLRGWLVKKRPRGSGTKYIVRLERFFGMEPNSLLQISGVQAPGVRVVGCGGETKPIEYRNTLGQLTRIVYCVKPAPDSVLRAQWQDFLSYKTAATLKAGSLSIREGRGKKRTRRGKWRVSPCPLTVPSEANWWAFMRSETDGAGSSVLKEVASARIAWAKVSAYLGWLRLDQESGGAGRASLAVETMAWLACPDYLEQYLDWMKCRVGARNQGATQFLAFVASLVRPGFGYLAQMPELASTLPADVQPDSWEQMCQETFEIVNELTAAYDGEIEVTRDSFEPIMHILQMSRPMDAVADMLQRMRAERPVSMPSAEAVWSRDMVLIRILSSNPLRLRNLSHLTYRPDDTGELHRRADGSWWMKIHKSRFKNTRGAAGDREHYECQVHPSAWADIEKYVNIHRPKLLEAPSDLFFITRGSAARAKCRREGRVQHRPWGDLGKRVKELTQRYLYKCAGVGCHSFRHIVATSILKADGGDFKTAALVLYDRPTTVEKHYAFLTANQGADRMATLLAESFRRM